MPPAKTDETPRILFAEDDDAVAAVVKDLLADAGYRVTRAVHGQDALNTLSSASFDLLLTDIRMPHLDGVGLITEVRSTGAAIPVVVLSGYMTPMARDLLDHLGVPPDAVLEKPAGLPELESAIRRALDGNTPVERHQRPSSLELTQGCDGLPSPLEVEWLTTASGSDPLGLDAFIPAGRSSFDLVELCMTFAMPNSARSDPS